jgi:hypothetical protein
VPRDDFERALRPCVRYTADLDITQVRKTLFYWSFKKTQLQPTNSICEFKNVISVPFKRFNNVLRIKRRLQQLQRRRRQQYLYRLMMQVSAVVVRCWIDID